MILTLQNRNLLSIPRELRKALRLEPGAPLEAHIERGRLVLTPVAVIPSTFVLSESGRKKEDEAEADKRAGRVLAADSAGELVRSLKRP